MGDRRDSPRPTRFLSLRWKTLIALSLLLVAVNTSLVLLGNERAMRQFDLQRAAVRDQQARQLRAMVNERNQEMSKLASLVPLLGGGGDTPNLESQLRQALEGNGVLLDVEWDIRSVHWVNTTGRLAFTWPADAQPPPPELLAAVTQSPENTVTTLSCRPGCGQYLATPMLWRGQFAGTLVLSRSLADSLLAFNALTGAEIAIAPVDARDNHEILNPQSPEYLRFPAITYPDATLPILRAAGQALLDQRAVSTPILVQQGDAWFEIFRIAELATGVDAYAINGITAQRQAIRDATRDSLFIGLLGLLLSETLLLLIMRAPLLRLRHLASVLPLLAENRYTDLRSHLAIFDKSVMPRDEIDLMVETVGRLTDRMEVLQSDRELAEARLVWLADHDPLTRLLNRRRFNDEFERLVSQAARYGHQGALLFMDLDQFKDVNDLSGHQLGDTLLQRVAEQLQRIVQASDLLARLGGDEFALVLPEATPEEAITSAEAVQGAIRSISIQARGRRHRISASIGIVMFPAQGLEIRQLMANADLAMYQAKDKGRGRWYLFSEQDQGREQLDARVLWSEQINEALRHGRFELHAQPIINIATGELRHLETLLRMRDPQGGTIYPDRFIPIAEKTGQIQAIDHWVLNHALEVMHRQGELCLSVNLSANAMDDPLLLPNLERLLASYGITPSRLSFEVTETAAINSLASATRLMRSIQELGCRFALDDFGSGHASYAYLRQLPVDDVKIDGAFIRDLANNREDRIFVKAITDMAHGMGKTVIAEFVETAEILAILAELGVDCAQGYHIGRPTRID